MTAALAASARVGCRLPMAQRPLQNDTPGFAPTIKEK